uniref:Uncharacterized protein n=1 Tax=Anopheles dirus TaxID=7168 RepID=A0A182NJ98_9DIPT
MISCAPSEAATCETIKCKDRQHCLTDLKTHKPRCVSCSYKCPRTKRQQDASTVHICIPPQGYQILALGALPSHTYTQSELQQYFLPRNRTRQPARKW